MSGWLLFGWYLLCGSCALLLMAGWLWLCRRAGYFDKPATPRTIAGEGERS